jgi:hypothetical protein
MLSQIQRLSQETEGRYATDEELVFLMEYARSFELRVQTYQKLQANEAAIVQQVIAKVRSMEPDLLQSGTEDLTAICKRDTTFGLRVAAAAMLIDDPESLRERVLFWWQTIVRAFKTQRNSSVIYAVMPEIIKQHLTPNEASLILPMLEVNRRMLGTV